MMRSMMTYDTLTTPYRHPTRRELRAIGWSVAKVVMVPDEVAAIAQEVATLSRWVQGGWGAARGSKKEKVVSSGVSWCKGAAGICPSLTKGTIPIVG